MGNAHEWGYANNPGSDSWRDRRNNIFSRSGALSHFSRLRFIYKKRGLNYPLHWLFYRGKDLYYKDGDFTRLARED